MNAPDASQKYAPEIVATADGSHTLFIPSLGEHYHSFHSSVREAWHVYVEAGLKPVCESSSGEVHVFELGFGSGLNALVAALYANEAERRIQYRSIELYPLKPEMSKAMNYPEYLNNAAARPLFDKVNDAVWGRNELVSPHFTLHKFQDDFLIWDAPHDAFDLFFFDAFGFRAQEELWTVGVFRKCYNMLKPGARLVTYASKGLVRRNMQEAGLEVEKLPGPPGKREMVRATKPTHP